MKQIIKLMLGLFLPAMVLVSCEKDEQQIFLEGGTAPTLSANRTTTIPLSFLTEGDEAVTLSWTNPNYQFTTGVSSHDVTYMVEVDTVGANFTNPKRKQLSISSDLGYVFTQTELNNLILNDLELRPSVQHDIEIRVRATIAGATGTELVSNVLGFRVTPFTIPPKVATPASGALYITGNAVPSDWTNTPPASQKFTVVTPTLYELTVAMIAGNSYLFLPDYGSWDAKYGFTGANNANNVEGDEFKAGGGDMKAPAVSGNYKIQVNFQTGKYSVTKQ